MAILQPVLLSFQDPGGNPLANGTVEIYPMQDISTATSNGPQVAANRKVYLTLNSSGQVIASLWTTSNMVPSVQYQVTAKTAGGQVAWQGQMSVAPGGAIIRSSAIQSVSASPFTVSFPNGTEVGDLVVIFCGNQDSITNPSGWTDIDNTFGGANWAGAAFYKVMTSADISAGSVSVSAGGTGVAAIIVIAAGTFNTSTPIREFDASRNSSGASSETLSTTSNIITTDLLLFFGSNLATSTDTVNAGTQQAQLSHSGGSGCLYSESGVSGEQTVIFSYGTAGSGNFQIIVAVELV